MTLQLPNPPGALRRFWARHPLLSDSLIAAGYLLVELLLLIGAAVAAITGLAVSIVHGAVIIIVVAALLVRRRLPWVALAAVAGAELLLAVLPEPVPSAVLIAVVVALYTVAAQLGSGRGWLAFGGVTVIVGIVYLVQQDPQYPWQWLGTLIPTALVLAVAVLVGVNTGAKRRYVAALVDRAEQLARERDQQARLSAAAERARIAGELHDIVAHGLSVMVRLADGAEALAEQNPEASRMAVQQIAVTGRASLAEMRRLMGVLREDDASGVETDGLAPQPDLAALPSLVESYRAAGLPVVLETSGRFPTAGGVQLTVYRAVQEGLTNTLRHASAPTRVSARVTADPDDGIVVEVIDDGAAAGQPHSDGAGRGLIGMAERAALYGGSVSSGPLAGGGWRTRVTLPQARDDDRVGEAS